MFFHLIPLSELKKHSVTYWRPGRDCSVSADTWIVLSELKSGYAAAVLELPADGTDLRGDTARFERAEDVLARFLRGESQAS